MGSITVARRLVETMFPHFGEFSLTFRENLLNPLSYGVYDPLSYQVTRRIRRHVLHGGAREAWRLKESYRDPLALVAVSTAIVAQIAITLPNLPNFGIIHWTATAFAYTSLVNGLLATVFAFYVQQTLGELHTPEDVYAWLTCPREQLSNDVFSIIFGSTPHKTSQSDRIPSVSAATILTTPTSFLVLAILCLFVSLGIYLGSVYSANLGSLQGTNANLAVLLFFIIFSALGFLRLYFVLSVKMIQAVTGLARNSESGYSGPRDTVGQTATPTGHLANHIPSEDSQSQLRFELSEALKASTRAQEESLKAQKALLELLDLQI